MKAIIPVLLFLLFSCANSKECKPSKEHERSIKKWLVARGENKQKLEFTAATDFPKKFIKDTEKCATECRVHINGVEIIVMEYHFSPSFITDHALEATRGEFIENENNDQYFRVANVSSSNCVVLIIENEKDASMLKASADAYFENLCENTN